MEIGSYRSCQTGGGESKKTDFSSSSGPLPPPLLLLTSFANVGRRRCEVKILLSGTFAAPPPLFLAMLVHLWKKNPPSQGEGKKNMKTSYLMASPPFPPFLALKGK